MEYRHLVKDSNNPGILAFSEALKKTSVGRDYDCYYTNDESPSPYFKIGKSYKKENPDDPDIHYIFVDVDDAGAEYSLFGNFAEEHFTSPDECALITEGLYLGSLCEAGLVSGTYAFCAFIVNRGDPVENVNAFSKELNPLLQHFSDNPVHLGTGHMHIAYSESVTKNMIIKISEPYKIPGVEVYLVSSVFAEHPEYYVIQ